jgi:hypothetical protein
MNELLCPKGYIQAKIKYKNEKIEILRFKNQVLNKGKSFLARCLLEENKSTIYIANMLFGDGGTINGIPKEVSPSIEHLSGVTRIKKAVVSQIDLESPMQAIFTVIIGEEEGNDFTMNEMGLEFSDESLFSLSTFADFNKTDQMEITWSWNVSFL